MMLKYSRPEIAHIFSDEEVSNLTNDELLLFTYNTSYYTKHVDTIFEKVFNHG